MSILCINNVKTKLCSFVCLTVPKQVCTLVQKIHNDKAQSSLLATGERLFVARWEDFFNQYIINITNQYTLDSYLSCHSVVFYVNIYTCLRLSLSHSNTLVQCYSLERYEATCQLDSTAISTVRNARDRCEDDVELRNRSSWGGGGGG